MPRNGPEKKSSSVRASSIRSARHATPPLSMGLASMMADLTDDRLRWRKASADVQSKARNALETEANASKLATGMYGAVWRSTRVLLRRSTNVIGSWSAAIVGAQQVFTPTWLDEGQAAGSRCQLFTDSCVCCNHHF